MQVVYERCCGLDVHKKTVVACVLVTSADGVVQRTVRTFATMTADLLALDDWLRAQEIGQVAMESSGVYWQPVYNLLEEGRTMILVNPQHMQAVPGRKTDVKDAEWIADLLRHGLLQPSFIPPQPIRDLRELTRYRKALIQQRAQEANRLQKVLESANLKLAAVATDVLGKSGRQMLEHLLGGEQDPEVLAELARGRLRAKLPALRQALEGRVRPHHRVLLQSLLEHIEFLETALARLTREIEQYLAPYAEAVAHLAHPASHGRDQRRGHRRRDRRGYVQVSQRQAPRFLGWSLPRQPAEWRQTPQWQNDPGQRLVTRCLGRSGLGIGADLG